ncbi:MAG TPA: molybdopterin-dependent oxidoreductase, partial [Nonomuraea sp.]|nr:molybdopterin-dependent oxidoreductase [Nonomuraea sp.]
RALVGTDSADAAGVPAASIGAAREAMAAGDIVVVLGRPSLAESGESVAAAAAVLAAAIPGARFLPALRRANVHGALDLGLAPGVLPGRVGLDAGREWFTAVWPKVPTEAGRDTAGILADAATGKIQCLVLLGADPLADFPDRELARRGVSGAGFVVAVDTFLTESSRQADVVLPAATFAERPGTTTNLEGRVTRLGQKITAPGVAWPDWMIAAQLARQLGEDLGFDDLPAVWEEVTHVSSAHAQVTTAALDAAGHRDGVLVGSGVADGGRPPMLGPPGSEQRGELPALDAYSLRLVSGRQLYDRGTLVQQSPALAGLVRMQALRVNPYDLDRLGLTTGGQVRVRSSRATLIAPVVADAGVPRGSAFLPFNTDVPGAAELIDATVPVTDVRIETVTAAGAS